MNKNVAKRNEMEKRREAHINVTYIYRHKKASFHYLALQNSTIFLIITFMFY